MMIMDKFGSFKSSNIHVEFVTEVELNVEQEIDAFSFSEEPVALINEQEFVKRFQAIHNNKLSEAEIIQFWHSLFGNFISNNLPL